MNHKKGEKEKVIPHIFASNIIGTSQKIQNVVTLIEKIADSPLNVLITGESGTGKELAARTIHINSSRSDKSFIDINCAALPESLLESELFGIEKGVATGVDKRLGKIEAANGGTLFLDEIGDMSLSAQAKLLRVLQERKMERIGGRTTIEVDVRVIAATNKDLKKEIVEGSFREDLYYRLNTVHIYMPSLREIENDIPLLAVHFLNKFTNELGKAPMSFSSEALNFLINYSWPGNVRELQNEVKRAAILAEETVINEKNFSESVIGTIPIYKDSFDELLDQTLNETREKDFDHFQDGISLSKSQPIVNTLGSLKDSAGSLRGSVEEVEIRKIKEALNESGGNKQKASRNLGLTRQGLIYKMKRYGLYSRSKSETKCKNCGKYNPLDNDICVECLNKHSESKNLNETIKLNEQEAQILKKSDESKIVDKNILEGERKLVTVIVVGISDLHKFSDELDPEEVRNLMNECFGIVNEEVQRYGGTISQFTGNGVIVLFGAPVAVEDHSYRAVNASLEIQRAIKIYSDKFKDESGLDLKITIGIDTGLVVVGTISHHLRIDYTAVGDAVNFASYLQNKGESGKVLITANTQKLVGENFITRPLGKVQIEGRSGAIKTYEVVATRGTRTRIDIQLERGLTRFTGREKELGILRDCFKEINEGSGQIVFILGEPGVGKSRLLFEFRKSLSGKDLSWFEGRCMNYGSSIAYFPLTEIIKRIFQIADKSDNAQEIIRKLEEGVLLLGSDLELSIPYLKHLLSVDTSENSSYTIIPQNRRAEIFEALRKIILRTSRTRPLILVIEDLHWMDKTSQEFLALLADSIPALPVLLILTYRPDYSHSLGERTYHTRIALRNLNSDESVRMAESLLDTIRLPDELSDLIIKKAEGNPFVIEELIRSLLESETIVKIEDKLNFKKDQSQIIIPSTIQDIIMARIDRIGDKPKKTLQVASVIGREFGFRLLKMLSTFSDEELRDHLLTLRNTELIYERGFSLDANYVFKHALTHEVTYNSLLIKKRKVLHEKTGGAIEELYPNRVDEFYEILAHHFSRTDNGDKALYYLTMAGKKAKSVFATVEALDFFNQALTCLDKMPKTEKNIEKRIDILVDIENIYDATGNRDYQEKILKKMIDLSKALNDEKRISDVYVRHAEFLSVMGDYTEAESIINSALLLKKKIGDKAGEGMALRGMGFIYWSSGDYEAALKYHQDALNIHRELGGGESEGFELISLGEIYRKLGRYDEALSSLREALKIYDALRIISGQHVCIFNIGSVYRDMGDYQACLEHYHECWRIVNEEGGFSNLNQYVMLSVPSGIASIYWHLGNYEESLKYYNQALDISRGLNDKSQEGRLLSFIASIHNLLGDYRKSIDDYEEALRIIREIGDRVFEGKILVLIGDIYRQNLKDYQRALSYYVEGLDIAKENSHNDEIRNILNSLGVINWNLGRFENALAYYQQALEICKISENKIGEGVTLSGMGVVYLSLSKYDEALKCNREALTLLKALGDQKIEGYILNSIGNVHYEKGEYDSACKFYKESLKIRENIGDRKGEAWILQNLGNVFKSLKNYDKSEKHYKRALSLAEELNDLELIASSQFALSQLSV